MRRLVAEYDNLPLGKSLSNFSRIYNDVFINELPGAQSTYALCELIVVEHSGIGTGAETLKMPFKYSFSNNTSRYANYARSPAFVKCL